MFYFIIRDSKLYNYPNNYLIHFVIRFSFIVPFEEVFLTTSGISKNVMFDIYMYIYIIQYLILFDADCILRIQLFTLPKLYNVLRKYFNNTIVGFFIYTHCRFAVDYQIGS